MNTLPPAARGLIQLLSGLEPDPPLTETEWQELTALAERTHCSLYLPRVGVNEEARLAANRIRRQRIREAYDEAAAVLSRESIDFVVIKGFTQEADTGIDPARRYQSDLDFLCLPDDIGRAQGALRSIGYSEHGSRELSTEHARPLVKPFTWSWRGDYYDPDLPISIELHHTLWSERRDRIPVPDIRGMWNRRIHLSIDGRHVPALGGVDRLAVSALHALRHILRNHASPAHIYELACALDLLAGDREFWDTWARSHDAASRTLQAIAFEFAKRWFGCRLAAPAEKECRALSERVQEWFKHHSFSPLANLVQPNKDVLWLHLALLPNRDRFSVALERLLPMRIPRSTEREGKWGRVRYHAVALARALATSARRRPAAASTASQISD